MARRHPATGPTLLETVGARPRRLQSTLSPALMQVSWGMTILHLLAYLLSVTQPPAPAIPGSGWAGTWTGALTNFPRPSGAVMVTRGIGPFPTTPNACTPWKTTYSEPERSPQTRAYQLCRGAAPTEFYIDEGNGVRLAATWLGDLLVSTFTYDATLLTSISRVRGDVFEEDIFTAAAGTSTSGIHSLPTRTRQRLILTRSQ